MDSENSTGADNQQETSQPRVPLDPNWIAGFVDGEGCFSVSVHRSDLMHRHGGWQLQAAFQVYQHRDYDNVLQALRSHFRCGYVRSEGSPERCPHLFGLGTPRPRRDHHSVLRVKPASCEGGRLQLLRRDSASDAATRAPYC